MIGTGFETGIAPPALAALRDQQDLARLGEIPELLAGVNIGDHRAYGDGDKDVIAAVPGAVVAAAALAVLTAVGARDAKIRQGVHALHGLQIDAAAQTAVTAIGAAEGHEFLAAKAHAAAAAVAGLDLEFGFVDEFHAADSLAPHGAESKKGGRLPYPLRCLMASPKGPRISLLLGNDVDVGVPLGALDLEFNDAVGLREQGVIGADADVHAGAIHRAALTDQNVAGKHVLTAEFLDP